MPLAKAVLLVGSVAIAGLAACSGAGKTHTETSVARAEQTSRMAWWREARFGMFIHWGLYAIPAGEWPMGAADANKDHAEWIRDTAKIPVQEYEKLQPMFDPAKFDAELWAKTAAAAGMKYLVITSKHHDGFCLFDSKWTDWDIGGTPFKRDILKELSEACSRHGIRFCTYHSIMDWHHPDYLPRRPWEKAARPEGDADYARFEEYLHREVQEVVTRYHPAVMWFDGEWESTWNHERGLSLFELCRKLDPSMIVNNRVDVHRGGMGGFSSSNEAVGDFATPEQEIPATGVPGLDWETCMTMNDHWGFNAADRNWKTAEDLIRKLADIASKGGNFLLNVGPRADGTFPPEAVERLAQIGAWMRVNGDAIHGTTASPFDALAFGRCTVKADEPGKDGTTTLYLHVFDWPKDQRLVVPGLGNEVVRAYQLAQPGRILTVARRDSDVWIAVPDTAPDPIDSVVALEIRGRPVVYKAPKIEAASDIFVKPLEVKMVASVKELEIRYTTDGSEPTPASPGYEHPVVVKASTTVRARAFHHGLPVSASSSASFEKVEPYPGGAWGADVRRGAWCARLQGVFESLPDFSESVHWERVDGIGLAPSKDENAVNHASEHVALLFRGEFEIETDDVYVFELRSDDGSRLEIDGGRFVLDNDGLHSSVAKRGAFALGKGAHAISVAWFNKTGGADLSLTYGAQGEELRPVAAFESKPMTMRRK